MEKALNAYNVIFTLVSTNVKKALAFAEAIPVNEIYPELIIPYLKSENENVQNIAELLIMKAPRHRLYYQNLSKLMEADNENINAVILLLARKVIKNSLNFKEVVGLTTNQTYPQIRQFGFVLLIKNFIDELSLPMLILCQEVEDDELASAAYSLALLKTRGVFPETLFDLLDTNVPGVKKLVREICLGIEGEYYSLVKLREIFEKSKIEFARYLAGLLLLHKFSDMLSFEELEAIDVLLHEDIKRLIPLVKMDKFNQRLNFEDYLLFMDSGSDTVKMKARTLALQYPTELLHQDILFKYLNHEDSEVRSLTEDLLDKIPSEDLDYKYMIEWLPEATPLANMVICNLLRKIPIKLYDPEVLAVYTNNPDVDIVRIATELALKLSSDYANEADEFVKNYFNG